jgi:hypothetical protein
MSKFGNRVLGFFGLSSGGGGTPVPQNLQQTLDTGNQSDISIILDDGGGDVMELSYNEIVLRLNDDTNTSVSLQKGINIFTNGYYKIEIYPNIYVFSYQGKQIILRASDYQNDPVIELPDIIDSKLELQNTNYGGIINTLVADYVVADGLESTIYTMGVGDENDNGYSIYLNFDDGLTMYFCFGDGIGTGVHNFTSDICTIIGAYSYASLTGLLIATRIGNYIYMSQTTG